MKIRHKYEAAGHGDYCEKIGEALYSVSLFAYQYSFIARRKSRFHIEELDINPFVFSEGGRFLAVDGNGRFSIDEELEAEYERPGISPLKAFFEPDGIAVAGVSSEAGKFSPARVIVELLGELGRTDVFCMNPKGGSAEIGGKTYPLYLNPTALPRSCSLYVFAAPGKNTLLFLDAVPDNSAVVLISGMPPELSHEELAAGVARQRKRGDSDHRAQLYGRILRSGSAAGGREYPVHRGRTVKNRLVEKIEHGTPHPIWRDGNHSAGNALRTRRSTKPSSLSAIKRTSMSPI